MRVVGRREIVCKCSSRHRPFFSPGRVEIPQRTYPSKVLFPPFFQGGWVGKSIQSYDLSKFQCFLNEKMFFCECRGPVPGSTLKLKPRAYAHAACRVMLMSSPPMVLTTGYPWSGPLVVGY